MLREWGGSRLFVFVLEGFCCRLLEFVLSMVVGLKRLGFFIRGSILLRFRLYLCLGEY